MTVSGGIGVFCIGLRASCRISSSLASDASLASRFSSLWAFGGILFPKSVPMRLIWLLVLDLVEHRSRRELICVWRRECSEAGLPKHRG